MNEFIPFYSLNIRHLFLSASLMLFSTHAIASNPDELNDKYKKIKEALSENVYGIPIHIESENINKLMRGDVYAVINHPYNQISENLASLKSWCDIMPQHLNIKACTYRYVDNQCRLIFYTGRKFYEKPDNVYHLDYQFKINTINNNYFNAALSSEKGPLDTTDYLIRIEAIPLSENSTFIHLSYEYKYGFWTSIAMSTYLSTIGYNKLGFTVSEKDKNKQPIYIKGVRGVIERNSMRYFFAIKSYLDTLHYPVTTRFLNRTRYWFELTEKHHRQLYEMDKNDYVKYKKREHQNQIRLQKEINTQIKMKGTHSISSCIIENKNKKRE